MNELNEGFYCEHDDIFDNLSARSASDALLDNFSVSYTVSADTDTLSSSDPPIDSNSEFDFLINKELYKFGLVSKPSTSNPLLDNFNDSAHGDVLLDNLFDPSTDSADMSAPPTNGILLGYLFTHFTGNADMDSLLAFTSSCPPIDTSFSLN